MDPDKSPKPSTRIKKGVSLTKTHEKDIYKMGTLVLKTHTRDEWRVSIL